MVMNMPDFNSKWSNYEWITIHSEVQLSMPGNKIILFRKTILNDHAIIKNWLGIPKLSEYRIIKDLITNREKQILNVALLFTCLRYEKAVSLRYSHDRFDCNFIHLPEWTQMKTKRKQLERLVRLSIPAQYFMRDFSFIEVL